MSFKSSQYLVLLYSLILANFEVLKRYFLLLLMLKTDPKLLNE